MIEIQRAEERGGAEHGWLHTRYSFSFSDYYNPKRMGFGTLRVLNDDIIEPAQGFPTHAHDNMEIVSIVLRGALEHKDSQGNHGIIRPGDVQRMSAGSGIRHSEFNHSQTEQTHLLQIWVYPRERGIQPGYEQKSFPADLRKNQFLAVVSGQPEKQALSLHQDAVFALGSFDAGKTGTYTVRYPGNGIYVFMIEGETRFEKEILKTGDAASFTGQKSVDFSFSARTELLVIEIPLLKS